MQHTLQITPEELKKYPAKGGILTSVNPMIEPGDTVLLTAGRNQVSMQVTEVEALHSRSCILWLKQPEVMLRAAGGIPPDVENLPPFSPAEKEVGDE